MPQSRIRDTIQTSRGKLDNLHRTPAEFTAQDFDGYGLCCLSPTRPARTASYSVSVRQVTTLLDASLKPCLAATLLRFANTSPPSGCVEDFHLQVAEHARHTKKGCKRMLTALLFANPFAMGLLLKLSNVPVPRFPTGSLPCCRCGSRQSARRSRFRVP